MNFTRIAILTTLLLSQILLNDFTAAREALPFYVSKQGDDEAEGSRNDPYKTIQHALDVAVVPGDKILVRGGTYRERIEFVASGNSSAGFITLRNFGSERVILNGANIPGQNMVYIENLHHVQLLGFEIVNNFNVTDGSGVRIEGYGNNIVIRNNTIRDMRGKNAMGITVYATSTERPITRLTIKGNHIFDCEPAPSEALTVNGNVSRFTIEDNVVHDVNNIGIDAIGGEQDINPDRSLVARNGAIINNIVYRARSSYGGGFGAGIYVDGGRKIRVEGNEVFQCDLGIEIGAENRGVTTRAVRVMNNLVHRNDKAGIVFGGYDSSVGRVRNCRFINNTLYKNDSLEEGYGQIWVQYAEKCIIANNIVWGSGSGVMLQSESGAKSNRFDYNLWNLAGGSGDAEFIWEGDSIVGFNDYRNASGQGANSLFGNPRFQSSAIGQFGLKSNSRAIDAGTNRPSWFASIDIDGVPRPLGGEVDIGAVEAK